MSHVPDYELLAQQQVIRSEISSKRVAFRKQSIGMAIIVVLTASALLMMVGTDQATATITVLQTPSNGVFSLTLIEIMDSEWNSTLAQPNFYVQGDHGLESSANISLPARTLIRVTIVSHDTPTPGNSPEYGKVSGTVGGSVYLINDTIASGTNVSQPWGQNVTSVPADSLAHTFTIQQLGINIPVVGGSTVIAYLYFDKPGTYTWICLTPCGFGPNGAQGAMSTPGWMTGSIAITPPKFGENPVPSPVSGGISFETAATVAFGMIVVGFVAGLVVLSKIAFPKRSPNQK